MMKKKYLLFICFTLLRAQGLDYAGPNDPAGDIEAEREGYMNGNRAVSYTHLTLPTTD